MVPPVRLDLLRLPGCLCGKRLVKIIPADEAGLDREQLQLRMGQNRPLAAVQHLAYVGRFGGDDRHRELGATVSVMITDFGHRDLKPAKLRQDRAQVPPFVLQRPGVTREKYVEHAGTDKHKRTAYRDQSLRAITISRVMP